MEIIKRIGFNVACILIILVTILGAMADEIPYVQLEDTSVTNVFNFFEFNETYADTLYYSITNPFGFFNLSDFNIADYSTTAQANLLYAPVGYGDEWNKTYADTLYTNSTDTNTNCSVSGSCTAIVYNTNTTWITDNQNYNTTDEMFNAVDNGTFYLLSNPYNFYNESDFVISDYSTTAQANLLYAPVGYGDEWNKTYADTLYTNSTDTNTNCSVSGSCTAIVYNTNTTWITDNQNYNTTDEMFNAVDNGTFYLLSNPYNFYNESDFVISDYSTTAQANLLYAPVGYGDEWNKTYADTLYPAINYNPFNQVLNTTSDVRFNDITTNSIILDGDVSNHKIYDNSSCIIIQAGTTYLEVCE